MAKLGAYSKDSSGRYRDLTTGQFISQAEGLALDAQARRNGFLGAATQGRFGRAADTLAVKYNLSTDDSQSLVASYLEKYRAWADAGQPEGEAPTLSPTV